MAVLLIVVVPAFRCACVCVCLLHTSTSPTLSLSIAARPPPAAARSHNPVPYNTVYTVQVLGDRQSSASTDEQFSLPLIWCLLSVAFAIHQLSLSLPGAHIADVAQRAPAVGEGD